MDDMELDRRLDGIHRRRMEQEERFLVKLEKQWIKAERMIGVLIREGKRVYYIHPEGGRYREGTEDELFDFLVRNRYI